MADTRALWAGPGARRALRRGGAGTVEIALHPGGYVCLRDDGWLLVAHGRAPRGPLTVGVADLARAPLVPGEPVRVDATALRVGTRLCIDIEPVLGDVDAPADAPLAAGWRSALAGVVAASPAPAEEFAAGLAALRRDDTVAAAALLGGHGPGLTPAGDDVLAGYAAWRHAAGAPVRLPRGRCSPLGHAYLRCAERGELPAAGERVIRAIRAGDATAARRSARALAGWGASSGTAILWGVAAAAGP